MAIVPLAGRVRAGVGKGPARQARLAGEIPGVIYGAGEIPTALAVPKKEFELALKTAHAGGNVIVALRLDGAAEQTAIIREVQRDPISHDILHLDFHHISLTEKVTVEVTVHLTGIPDGVKNGGGILEHITRSIEIECLPTQIPQHLEADVSALAIGDSIHVRDLSVPNAVVLSDPDTTIATVVPPTVMIDVVATPAAGTATEPEVIAKGKADEEGKDKDKDKDKK
jgi:large subunit ribosomal protein L25